MEDPDHDFFSQTVDRRFRLRVEGVDVWVSKDVLAMYSPVFRAMLFGSFREGQQEMVELPDKNLSETVELFKVLFACPDMKPVSGDNVELMLRFAAEYQISDLRRRCAEYISNQIDRTPKGDQAFLDLLSMASQYDLKPEIRSLIPKVSQLASKLVEEYHDKIDIRILATIYQSKMKKYAGIISGLPETKNHQKTDSFDERKPARPCHVVRCNSLFTCFCRKCSFWFCPNHMHGCPAYDEHQKCNDCGLLVGFYRSGEKSGTDRCGCGYEFSEDLLDRHL